VFASHEQVEKIVADRRIRAVKYTGGNEGGNKIAALAGKHMKKGTFELGGNDAFIVL
jgi:succinate-semialdehyde dehydrogenase/glutarate-semialdehyde dehydrogenase